MSSEELPKNWAQCELSEVVDILDSQRVPVNNTDRQARLAKATTTYPYYGATGQVGEIDDFIFEGESILLGEDGAPFLEPQKPKAYVVQGRYWVNNHAHILRAVNGVKNHFLCHQLNVLDYKPHVSGTTRLKLTQGSLKTLPLKLAPLNEQHRIVEKIETLFARIDKGEEALCQVQKLLKRYRQSILKAAVTGELTRDWREANQHKLEPASKLLARILETRRKNWQGRRKYKEPLSPALVDLPQLPVGWSWAGPEQLSKPEPNSMCIGPFGSNLKVSDYRESGVPLIFVRHIRSRDFNGRDSKFVSEKKARDLSSHRVRPGDLLITKMGDPPGDVAIYPKDAPTAILTADCIRLSAADSEVSPSYLELAISSPLVQAQIKKISKGVAQQKVSLANFKRIGLPIPPYAEQREISSRVTQAIAQVDKLERSCELDLDRSSALRQSILKSAFTGQLVPQEPDDEPASELLARIRAGREAAPRKPSKKRSKKKTRKSRVT